MKKIIIILSLNLITCFLFSETDTTNIRALKAIYDATNGTRWSVYHWDFNDSKLKGVKTHNGKVVEISTGPNELEDSIPPEIALLSELRFLSFSSGICIGYVNYLSPDIIPDGKYVNELPCENKNQIQSVAPEIGQLQKLETLILDGNKIDSLPREIGNLTNLNFLNIGWNKIYSLPGEIGNLSNLKELDVAGNRLTELPQEIGNLKKLKKLDLKYNRLTTIPNEIGNLNKLKELDLSKNKIDQLPEGLFNLKKLGKLDLSGNKLTFEDIEPLIGKFDHIIYANQEKTGKSQTIGVTVGEDINLKVDVGGEHNVYRWYKDDVFELNSTSDSLVIKNAKTDFAGTYVCKITNTVAKELVLESEPFEVVVSQQMDTMIMSNPKSPEIDEIEKHFVDFYMVDVNGNRIEDYIIGDTVFCVIVTENCIGEKADIDIEDAESDYIYDGSLLKSLYLEYTIKSDKDELMLITVRKKELESYLDFHFEKEGQKTNTFEKGDIITIVIDEEDKQNKMFTLDFNDQNVDFVYKGKRLKNDILNCQIKEKEEIIKLKVVAPKR